MGIFSSFATGFLQGQVDVARERRAAEIAAAEAQAENQQKARDRFIDYMKSDERQEGVARFLAKEAGYSQAELGEFGNLLEDAANYDNIGGKKIKLTAEYQYKDPNDKFVNAGIFWDSLEQASAVNYDDLLNYYQNDEQARKTLQSRVAMMENNLRIGNINSQRAADRSGNAELRFIDLHESYSNATRLLDALGFQPNTDAEKQALAAQFEDYNPETQSILSLNTMKGQQNVLVDNDTYGYIETMAARNNLTVDQMTSAIAPLILSEEDMRDKSAEDIAFMQNSILMGAAKLEARGYGQLLTKDISLSDDNARRLMQDLKATFGEDRMMQIKGLAFLTGGAQEYFKKARGATVYSRTTPERLVSKVKTNQFVQDVFKIDPTKFQEGLTAQRQALDMLDQLARAEVQAAEETGSGFVRAATVTLKRLGIQISQAPGAFSNLFADNSQVFTNLDENTTQGDLQAVVEKLNSQGVTNIDLENITETEALRLALAAKMARAVDPSGRLSNQDFEIQLRRLGASNLNSPAEIQRSLQLLKDEFSKDLEYKTMVSELLANTRELTPVVAAQIQAANKLHEMEKRGMGAKAVGTPAAAPPTAPPTNDSEPPPPQNERIDDTPVGTLNGSSVYEGKDAEGNNIILDEAGNDVTDAFMESESQVNNGTATQ